MKKFEQVQHILNQELESITEKPMTTIERAKHSIQACLECLKRFKELVAANNFDHDSKEIQFFKYVKPKILAKLFYFTWILKIEQAVAFFNKDGQLRYYHKKLKSIERFAKKNEVFINYYKSTSTHFDDQYFRRINTEHLLPDEPMIAQYDTSFCTSHDYKAAKVIAKEELARYIDLQIKILNNEAVPVTIEKPKLKWTESKMSLVEVVYGLITSGAINGGEAELADVAAAFEKLFGIELPHLYNKFLEMKARKSDQTRFLSRMVKTLQAKIDSEEDNT